MPLLDRDFLHCIAIVKLGLRTARLINLLLNLHNFSLESERLSSYSHSWRAGAREDTVREVCTDHIGSKSVQRGIAGDSTGHIGPIKPKDTVL